MVSFRETWLTMNALCHAKFANHHCWFDALALIMQTGYKVSSLSVPVISRISMTGPYAIKPLGFISDWLYVQGVATPFFICSRGSSTPFLQWQGVALHLFSEA